MDKKRDFQGFLDLELFDDGLLIFNGYAGDRKKVKRFLYKDTEYFFKIISNPFSMYNELIVYELAKDFGIACVEYDLASLGEEQGVISKSFIGKNDNYCHIEDVLEPVYGYVPVKYNNLEDIWYALSLKYDETVVFDLMNQIVSIFLFDILIGNLDRNVTNFGIIENDKSIFLAPLFDNQNILSDVCIECGGYCLGIDSDDYFYCSWDLDETDNFLYKFAKVSDSKYMKIFEDKLWIISEKNLLKVFYQVENKIETQIPTGIKIKILNKFAENRYMINKVLEKTKIKKR